LKTPLKQAATSRLVLTEIQPDCQPLTTPPKPTEILPADPWMPTSNLKMLIRAARPEIRSREQRRELSNSTSEVLQARHCLQEHLSGDEYEKSQPSHKEKSLGLLCCKFLAPYPDYPSTAENIYVGLDEVAEELDVDHRRIYDIVNVLESLHMVSRLAKKRYAWHGRHNLSKTLQALKKVGEENKYTQQIQMIKKREYVHEFDFDGERNEEMARSCGSNEHSEMSFVKLPGKEFRAASVNSRKDKSLRVMSQKFGMLFLVLTPQIVSLEVAAKILIGEDQLEDLDKSKFKTVCQRFQHHFIKDAPESYKSVFWSYNLLIGNLKKFCKSPVSNLHVRGSETQCCNCQLLLHSFALLSVPCTLPPLPLHSNEKVLLGLGPYICNNQKFLQCLPLVLYVLFLKGESIKNERPPPNSSQMKHKMDNFQEEGQNKTKTLDQNVASCYDQCKREDIPEDEDKIKTKQDIPVAFAIPAHEVSFVRQHSTSCRYLGKHHLESSQKKQNYNELHIRRLSLAGLFLVCLEYLILIRTRRGGCNFGEKLHFLLCVWGKGVLYFLFQTFFPSGYLTPFTQCTHGNKAGFSDQEKAGICSLQHTTYSSPIAGVIPVTTSELKAVNIPAFHITPLNITLSPTSIAAAPVLSNSCLNSSSTSSAQNPSSSVLNFTLQHIGLIPAGVQVPANPVLQHTPVSSQPENVSHSSENMNLQEEKISKNTLQLLDGGGSTGNYSAVIPLQQPCVPEEPQEPPTVTENFFRTPGGPNTVSSLSANSDGTDRMSQGTLYIPQRNLEVSED
ncbi:Transcription factor E2F8, partial [Eudyptes schlegeli]